MNPRLFVKIRRSIWLLAMDSIPFVEEKLGSVESWPSRVIMDVSYEEPKVSISRRVAASMYDKCVSVSDAANFCNASQAVWKNVSETHMYGVYMQWAKCGSRTVF